MKPRHFLPLVALMGVASTSSMAATIDVTYAGSADFGDGSVGYRSGAIAPNPDSNRKTVSILIGGDSLPRNKPHFSLGQFNLVRRHLSLMSSDSLPMLRRLLISLTY